MGKLISKISSIVFVSFLFAVFISVHHIKAADSGNGFKISPVREELVIDKGNSKTVNLYVENITQAPINAKAVINDFTAGIKEDGQPQLIYDGVNPSHSFKGLVTTIPDIQIASKQKVTVPVTITVPGDAQAGGYYGVVRFIPLTNKGNDNLALSASVGTIFLIKVPGQLTESMTLTEFSAEKNGSKGRFFINGGNLAIITRLKNTGNIHEQPFGTIQVKDGKGSVVQEIEFNNTDPRANVLPNSTRKFTNSLKNQKWFGRYTITANLAYGDGGGNLITAKNTFWVLPSWIILVAIFAIFIIIALVVVIIHRKKLKKK